MSRSKQIWKLWKPLCIIISFSFFFTQIITLLHLSKINSSSNSPNKIGKFGKSLIAMLPPDLKFTLFLPHEKSFHRDLRLRSNDSNSYAALTRVLGFSTVPMWIRLADLEHGKEKVYDSISGYKLYVSKDLEGLVVVNGVVVVAGDDVAFQLGNLLVHFVDGVVMDSEFEASMLDDDDDE